MPAQGKFPARSYREFLLEKMRPGDIVTHCLADRYAFLTEDGKLNPDVTKARARGVKFDLGHAAGSFSSEASGARGSAGLHSRFH